MPRGPNISEETDGTVVSSVDGEPLLHIVFYRPQIHWNTGNIGRTCLGIGGARLHLIGEPSDTVSEPPDPGGRPLLSFTWRLCFLGALWTGPIAFSLDEKQVRRAGLDYWGSVDLQLWDSWDQFQRAVEQSFGPAELFFFTKYGAESLLDVEFPVDGATKIVLVFGNETDGLTEIEHLLEQQIKVALPMHNQGVMRCGLIGTADADEGTENLPLD